MKIERRDTCYNVDTSCSKHIWWRRSRSLGLETVRITCVFLCFLIHRNRYWKNSLGFARFYAIGFETDRIPKLFLRDRIHRVQHFKRSVSCLVISHSWDSKLQEFFSSYINFRCTGLEINKNSSCCPLVSETQDWKLQQFIRHFCRFWASNSDAQDWKRQAVSRFSFGLWISCYDWYEHAETVQILKIIFEITKNAVAEQQLVDEKISGDNDRCTFSSWRRTIGLLKQH